MAMTCISGIAQQWEKIDEIRATYREHGNIFFSLDPTATARVPKITVKEAAHHAHVLQPLLVAMRKAPRDAKGSVRLFGVPDCERQTFVLIRILWSGFALSLEFGACISERVEWSLYMHSRLKKLAELIFGAGNVPAKFADSPNKDAWCCKQMCSLVKMKVRKLRETGKLPKNPAFRDLMDLILEPRATHPSCYQFLECCGVN